MRSIIVGTMMFAPILIPGMAAAEDVRDGGFYLELFGGPTVLEDIDVDANLVNELTSDTGFNVGGALGFGIPLGFIDLRLEGQVTYRQNDLDEVDTILLDVDADGDVSALSGMGNAYLDLDFGTRLAAWVGAGIGYARVDLDFDALDIDAVDDDDDVLAYQAMAGISFDMDERTSLSLGYTYFWTEEASFADEDDNDFDADYASHDVKLGLVFRF